MTNRFPHLPAYALIALSFFAGMLLAVRYQRLPLSPVQPAVHETLPESQPAGINRDASTTEQNVRSEQAASNYLVQEPTRRSSYRLDFASSNRRSNQRNNFFMLRAFQQALGDSWKSTVRVMQNGEQVALGTVVDSKGWIISKASEIPFSADVQCILADQTQFPARVVTRMLDYDIALLQIDREDLSPIQWADSTIPARGNWVATADIRSGIPSAVGVVSAGIQSVSKCKAVLGVHLIDSTEGAAVTLVLPGSGAEYAGIQVGDTIYAVNGEKVGSRDTFLGSIDNGYGGQTLKLSISRADRRFDVEARLMDLADELLDETEMQVNGSVSSRATGFNRVFLHDTVLEPYQCGGPLVNLDGKAVGINIARAGRVTSYALPVDTVKPLVETMIEQAKLVSMPADSNAVSSSIR